MVKSKGKLYVIAEHKQSATKGKLEDQLDELFVLPLAEFTAARNTLAAQLKKSGRADDSARVKALAKPSVTAWAVNQLYWNHRDEFDQLFDAGARYHKAQSSRTAGKIADMRSALDERREALNRLSELATSLLTEAGNAPTPGTLHRITTTLEALSAYASRADAPRPGRLTHDVDPPGFETLGSFVPDAGGTRSTPKPLPVVTSPKPRSSQNHSSAAPDTRRKTAPDTNANRLEEMRKTKIAEAKASLQSAKRSLSEARARAQASEAAQKKADSEAKKADKQRHEAEENLRKAKAGFEDATRRARSAVLELEEAARAVKYAERTFEKAAEDLERLLPD